MKIIEYGYRETKEQLIDRLIAKLETLKLIEQGAYLNEPVVVVVEFSQDSKEYHRN